MDISEIIGTLGTGVFPIAMCGLLFWYMTREMEAHKQETDSLKEVIAKNTEALVSIKQMIEDKLND